jgi:hypothetical protein
MKDDLDLLIEELAEDDPMLPERVRAGAERFHLACTLADARRASGVTQVQMAERMGTSQGQVARFESGADTRMSTVDRYAIALGLRIGWTIEKAPKRRAKRSTPKSKAASKSSKVGSKGTSRNSGSGRSSGR